MRWTASRSWASWLGLVVLAFATPTTVRAGSIFDALPHMKKPNRPICNHYGECYGHFSVSYRPWPAACVVNPPLVPGKRPLQETLPSPRREPEDSPGKNPGAPTPGMLLEVENEPVEAEPTSSRIMGASARQHQPATRPAVPRTPR